jgi:hypothetical protein
MLLGECCERWSMMGEQRLVGGDHMLAGAERGLDRVLGNALLAADQLDENVDLRIAGELDGVGHEAEAGDIDAPVLAPVARGYGCDLDRPAESLGKGITALGEKSQEAASDCAETGEPEF